MAIVATRLFKLLYFVMFGTVLQKVAFRDMKGHLLPSEMPHIAAQYAAFWNEGVIRSSF